MVCFQNMGEDMKTFESFLILLKKEMPLLEIKENVLLSAFSTFRIGGNARLMAFPSTQAQVQRCVKLAADCGIRTEILGNGSNFLFPDEGVFAFFIHTANLQSIQLQDDGKTILAESGALLARIANFAAEHALTGFEFAHGIPGSLGGAVTMNAGAYGGQMADVIRKTNAISAQGQLLSFSGQAHQFSYRHSVFSSDSACILSAEITLEKGDRDAIKETMAQLSVRRRESQPLEFPSGGSTFKRPQGHFAAALIDQCGLKGLSVGGAQVSQKHAGFIINCGGATCADVLSLVAQVKKKVYEKTGVALELEIKTLEP